MSRLIEHIEYLSANHDCVVIPGVGALVKRYVSAVYDENRGMIYPPREEITFNAEINYDDGLIISSVSRREEIPYTDAAALINDEIEAMRSQIELDGRFSLGAVGELQKNSDGNVVFEPAAERLSLRPVQVAAVEAQEMPEEAPVTVRPFTLASRMTEFASRVAAVVALALILGFAIYNPTKVGEGVMKASMIPELPMVCFTSDTEEPAAIEADVTEAEEPVVEVEEVEESPAIQEAVSESTEPTDYRYYLIIASLPTQELAEQFIADEGGAGYGIIRADGRYRVWGAAGHGFSDVRRSDLMSRYPEAWVYTAR